MQNFSPLLGMHLPILGKSNSLITPSKLARKSQIPAVRLNQIALLDLQVPLIQRSRILANAAADRLHNSTNQSQIGWDNWQPIDRSSTCDNFDYKVDRSHFNLDDRSSQIDTVESPVLDFFTTVLSAESANIDPQLDSLPTHPAEVELPIPAKQDRFAKATQIQPLGNIQTKSFEPDRKLSDSNQIDQIEQPKSLIKVPQASTNTQPSSILQSSPITLGKSKIVQESSIALSLDNLALNAIDNSFLQPLLETTLDLNLDSTELPALNLTQISSSADEIATNLASPPELIPDSDAPAIINPAITPQVTFLEPAVTTSLISESAALSPKILDPFTVLEQIEKATEIAPNPESSRRLPSDQSDPIVQNPLDLPTVIDLQPPASTTAQPPLSEQRSVVAENIASVMPLTVEPVREIPSLNRSESPNIENQFTTDPAQITTSPDEPGIASPAIPELSNTLPSNPVSPTLPRFVDLAQITTASNETAPAIESIAQDLDRSPQLKSANPNIPESPIALLADALPINLRSDPHPEQIATSDTQIEIEADLQSTQVLNTDTFQFNSLDDTTINQASLALEQISTFAEEPTLANVEISPIPIAESVNTLAPSPLEIDPDLTIESIPRFSDFSQSNVDRSPKANIVLEATEVGKLAQEKKENTTKSSEEFQLDNSLLSPLTNRSVIDRRDLDTHQNNARSEYLLVEIVDESDDIANPINNPINNLLHVIQLKLNQVTTELPAIDKEELSSLLSIDSNDDNSTSITIPAPTVGYATGGHVKDVNHSDLQSIATSDTVSAMLTPGEFVINAKAAQKNLDLLTHINSGGEPEATLSSTEIQPSTIEPSPTSLTSTKIAPASIQRQHKDSLISSALQQEADLHQLSSLNQSSLDTFPLSQVENKSAPNYATPPLIFRKPKLATHSNSQSNYLGTDTPDTWNNIEDLMTGGNNNSDIFIIDNSSQQHSDLELRASPTISRFAEGGEVTPSDLSTTIASIAQTNESPITDFQEQAENHDPAELEILAREIYHRLRQRLEIERERHGSYSGNLAW